MPQRGRTWSESKKLAKELFPGDRYEQRFLREAAMNAPDAQVLDRITVVALGVPDIIELLPVHLLVP